MNRRVLVIDDNRSIHEDFRKILTPPPRASAEFNELEDELFAELPAEGADAPPPERFELISAHQGREGFEAAGAAEQEGRPFAVAFVDVRMPPGWDGVETIARLWEVSPRVLAVICTAYSDYSWDQIVEKLGRSDRLMMLRKPFDPLEVLHIAIKLAQRWDEEAAV